MNLTLADVMRVYSAARAAADLPLIKGRWLAETVDDETVDPTRWNLWVDKGDGRTAVVATVTAEYPPVSARVAKLRKKLGHTAPRPADLVVSVTFDPAHFA